jgi:hypothetical protein
MPPVNRHDSAVQVKVGHAWDARRSMGSTAGASDRSVWTLTHERMPGRGTRAIPQDHRRPKHATPSGTQDRATVPAVDGQIPGLQGWQVGMQQHYSGSWTLTADDHLIFEGENL